MVQVRDRFAGSICSEVGIMVTESSGVGEKRGDMPRGEGGCDLIRGLWVLRGAEEVAVGI